MIKYITEYIQPEGTLSLSGYAELGGFCGLKSALEKSPEAVLEDVKKSGLKGRGGAYFPTGIKMETVRGTSGHAKYIVCNADEGEPGTFKDRYLLEGCCWQIFEGMILAAYAVGAEKGYLYLRGEYRYMLPALQEALAEMHGSHLLGESVLGKNFSFDIEIRSGAGAYICGEESALLSSLEGYRGLTRVKPPIPAVSGLWGCPTLIDNVETFACITQILRHGSERFRGYGTESSAGTKLVCLSGCLKKKGVFEVPFGIPLAEILYELGGGPEDGCSFGFLQIGGLSGACCSPEILTGGDGGGLAYNLDSLKAAGLSAGTGAIFAAPDTMDILEYIRCGAEFYCEESCGRCVPCREGTRQILRELERLDRPDGDAAKERISRICSLLKTSAACGLGQAVPVFLESALKLWEVTAEKEVHHHE